MLNFCNVSKRYGENVALHSTDLEIEEERTTVLIGPSGCGKSTLLRLIAGLVLADEGQISFLDTPLDASNITRLRHRMGYMIQEGGLFPHFTGERNVSLMAHQLGWSDANIDRRVHELLELVQLPAECLKRYPGELSGGQRQRISLMRALMLDPDLLLLDEPLGALDPMIRYELQQELKEIFEQLDKTVVMVTHDIAEAAFFGHTLILMRRGKVLQKGPFSDLAHEPADEFVAEFIGAQRKQLKNLSAALAT
jgi:osmoprotectant transport system ATP-binding protein